MSSSGFNEYDVEKKADKIKKTTDSALKNEQHFNENSGIAKKDKKCKKSFISVKAITNDNQIINVPEKFEEVAIQTINNYGFNESGTTKINHKINESSNDTTLGCKRHLNKSIEITIPKKKKKNNKTHYLSLDLDLVANKSVENELGNQIHKKTKRNIEETYDYENYNECVTKKKCDVNESTDVSLAKDYHFFESVAKTKKNNKNIISEESMPKKSKRITENTNNYDDFNNHMVRKNKHTSNDFGYDSLNKCVIKTNCYEKNKFANLSLVSHCLNKSYGEKSHKKKKKHKQVLTTNNTEENRRKKIEGNIESVNSYDESLESNDYISKTDRKTSPKKNKMNSVDLIANIGPEQNLFENTEKIIESGNNFDGSTIHVINKKCNKRKKSVGESLENNYCLNKNNEAVSCEKKKNHKKNSGEFMVNIDNEENLFKTIEVSIENVNNLNVSKECEIKNNRHKKNNIADVFLEDNHNLNESYGIKSGKKKKKREQKLNLNIGTEEMYDKTKESIENINGSQRCAVMNNNHKRKTSADVLLKDNHHLNESYGIKSGKKKKKCEQKLSLNIDTEEIYEKTKESIENVNGSQRCAIKKKNHKKNISASILSEDNSYLNESYGIKSPKEKKKREQKLNFNIGTEKMYEKTKECIENTNGSQRCAIKKKSHKRNASADVLLENNYHSNEIYKISSPEKKEKYRKWPVKLTTNTGSEEKLFENTEVKIENCNDLDSTNESVIDNIYQKKNTLADVSLENIHHLNESNGKKSHKKQKNLEQVLTTNDTEENLYENSEESIENLKFYDSFQECVIKKKSQKRNKPADVLVENNNDLNEIYEIISPKKKKNHKKKSVKLITNIVKKKNLFKNTEKSIENGNNLDGSNENSLKKKIHKRNQIADELLENNHHLEESLEIKSSINNEKKSVDLVPNVGTEENVFENTEKSIENGNNCPNVNVVMKKSLNRNESASTSFENNCHLNRSHETISIKQNINHENSSSESELLDSSSESSKAESVAYMNCIKAEKNKRDIYGRFKFSSSNNFDLINSKDFDIHVNLNNDSVPANVLDIIETEITKSQHNLMDNDNTNCNSRNENLCTAGNKNNKDDVFDHNLFGNENNNNDAFNHDLLSENVEYETLLNILNLDESTNTTSETSIKLNSFNLMDYLINSNPSLREDLNFNSILKDLSTQIKMTINLDCDVVTQSDIALLKYVGEMILKRIIKKHKSFEAVKNLHIKLPDECKKNKIHFVETTVVHQPCKEIMNNIKKLNPSLKLGIFNEEENDSIRQRWRKFQQEYKILDVQPFLSNGICTAIPSVERRLTFFRYISAELPNRLLFSINSKFNELFSNFSDKVKFKDEEDQIIMKVESCKVIKNKYAVLNLILNRSRKQLYRRLRSLKMKPACESKRVQWDFSMIQELFTYILLETKTKNWRDLQNMTIYEKTWINIIKHFKSSNVYFNEVKYQWTKLSTMLFCEKRIEYSEFKLIILFHLLKTNPKRWSDIDWVKIRNKFYPGANAKLLVSWFYWWIHTAVPPEIRKNTKDTLLHLSKEPMNTLLQKIKSKNMKFFPSLTVKNNVLVEKNY